MADLAARPGGASSVRTIRGAGGREPGSTVSRGDLYLPSWPCATRDPPRVYVACTISRFPRDQVGGAFGTAGTVLRLRGTTTSMHGGASGFSHGYR